MGSYYRILILAVFVVAGSLAMAQKTARPTLLSCAAPDLTDAQRQLLDREARAALMAQRANNAPTSIAYVPIRPHIFRQTNGTGGMSVAKMNDVIGTTNRYYLLNGYGIQFYFCGTAPDYVDNDTYYNSFSSVSENTIADAHDATNAMNMYIVHSFAQSGLGGYAYFPANGLYSTRSFILDESYTEDLGNRLIPHELGHNFNLSHTFQGSTGNNPELVTRGAGANCTTAGDLVCDTPADPYGRSGAGTSYINGCEQYTGTATDPQGALYTPSISNIMSYYFPCTHDFSIGQYDRMAAGLALRQSHTAYSLDCAPTPVTAPANLSAVLAANAKSVVLTWQDMASNEMGYFVERSTRPNDGFGAVGGVGTNVGTFTDVLSPGPTAYYYRIRPSNSTTGSLSPVVTVIVATCRPTYTSSCSATNGLAGVAINGKPVSTSSGCSVAGYSSSSVVSATVGAGQTIPLSATLLNSATSLYTTVWVDTDRNGTFDDNELLARTPVSSTSVVSLSLTIPVSLTAGTLPIRVLTATTLPTDPCGAYAGGETEDYTILVANPASCATPTALTASNVTSASAYLGWTASGTSFALQYRPSGTSSWLAVVGISSPGFSLTGLLAGQWYDWQVLTACGVPGSSTLSPIASFSTICATPAALTASPVYGNTAQLNWSGSAGNSYSVQWRPLGSSTWATLSGITSTNYVLNSLTVNTAYEWRVATSCMGGAGSYTNPVSFTTTAQLVYCQPNSQYGCNDNDGLNGLTIGSFVLSSNSGCSPGAYQSYTAVGATLAPGQTYSFTATMLSPQWQEGLVIWVDFNRDGSFDSGEQLYASPVGLLSATYVAGTLTFPANTAPGLLTLRARVEYGTIPSDPCAAGLYGETEDYVISVCQGASATLAGSQSIIVGQPATLTATLTGTSPWALSVSNGASFTGLTTSPFTFTVSPAVSTTYTLTQLSNVCGAGVASGTAAITAVVGMADLSLEMVINKRAPAVDEVVTYAVTLANAGPQDAYNVKVQSLLPPNMIFFGSSQSAVTTGPGSVSVAVGTLVVGTSATFSFSAQATAPGIYRTAAQITESSLPDPDSYLNSGTADGDDDAATVDIRTRETGNTVYTSPNPIFRLLPPVQLNQPAPTPTEADLSLSLQTDERTLAPGTPLSVSVVVANRGGLGATGVVVQLTLPAGWQLAGGSGLSQSGQTITLPGTSVGLNQTGITVIAVVVSGSGEQAIRALITAANQPDLDSSHANAFGLGEDDEASISVRVR